MRERPLILLIDDEQMFLDIAATKLQGEGFDTVEARGVPDAIEKVSSLEPDLVLSDVYMAPGPSGWDLALELRRNPKTKNVKIAFFTSLRDPWMELKSAEKAQVAAELGTVIFFSKTDDIEVLGARVAQFIRE
jgi:CheY-like chemotaxis protein